MATKKTEYTNDLSIDRDKLEEEWEDQALLFMKWGERCVEALYTRDQLKEKLDWTKADIDDEIRNDPGAFGFDKKPTETAISSQVQLNKRFIKATDDYLKAKKDVGILQVAKEAMEHKKKALEAETSLWIGNYYSDPKIPERAKEDSSRKVSEQVRKSLPIRRRKK
jgi:hypothetical protein